LEGPSLRRPLLPPWRRRAWRVLGVRVVAARRQRRHVMAGGGGGAPLDGKLSRRAPRHPVSLVVPLHSLRAAPVRQATRTTASTPVRPAKISTMSRASPATAAPQRRRRRLRAVAGGRAPSPRHFSIGGASGIKTTVQGDCFEAGPQKWRPYRRASISPTREAGPPRSVTARGCGRQPTRRRVFACRPHSPLFIRFHAGPIGLTEPGAPRDGADKPQVAATPRRSRVPAPRLPAASPRVRLGSG